VARPTTGVLKAAGKALDGVASAFESLFGGASPPKRRAKDDDRSPLDFGPVSTKEQIDEASRREQEQQSDRRQRYLRTHSREVPDEKQRDADFELDRKGRERTRGE
jgi:hypothetical protein